ncbi:hypothetical protein [Paraburkholderia nodosa]|uniref:hypothetical protein n=1 Tax=Paraburkholderia nodosa TaxID=392320 RepID=UPI00114D1D83|nr:hypothetical protein [Paraburkholderia nodosa]
MIDAKLRDCDQRIAEQEHRLESISQTLRTREDSEKLHANLTASVKALQELRRLVVKEVEKGCVDFFGQRRCLQTQLRFLFAASDVRCHAGPSIEDRRWR